jgi:lipopolysaccharide transport system permease protein
MLCLRFRDVQPLVGNVVQVAMFVTPILWPPDSLEGSNRLIFVDLNPIPARHRYRTDAAARQDPQCRKLCGRRWLLTYLFFHRFRHRIAYWS